MHQPGEVPIVDGSAGFAFWNLMQDIMTSRHEYTHVCVRVPPSVWLIEIHPQMVDNPTYGSAYMGTGYKNEDLVHML